MNIANIFSDIPILIVVTVFIFSIIYCFAKYIATGKNLKVLIKYLEDFKQNDLNFRFKEMDNWMSQNPYVSAIWLEFKNTLVFSESVALKAGAQDVQFRDVSSTVQNVQTTSDPLYYFNEETLITSKFNFKLVQTIPTILTGFGPLFTFLNIAIAFGMVDFSSQEKTLSSISGFLSTMQVAALVSVVAVSSSLIYLLLERTMYMRLCKQPLVKVQELLGGLFASISAEKFLYELLRESKLSNNSNANLMSELPADFKTAVTSTMTTSIVPYLENMLFGINQMNKQLKDALKAQRVDDVDDLF